MGESGSNPCAFCSTRAGNQPRIPQTRFVSHSVDDLCQSSTPDRERGSRKFEFSILAASRLFRSIVSEVPPVTSTVIYFGHRDRLSARARGIADVSERGDDPSIASQASRRGHRRQQRGGGRGNQAETPRSEQGARGKIETKRNPLFTGPATRWSAWGRGVREGRAIVPRGSNARKPSWEYPSDASRRFSGAFAALTRAARVPFRSFPRVRASAFSPPGQGSRPPRSSAAMLRRDRSDA